MQVKDLWPDLSCCFALLLGPRHKLQLEVAGLEGRVWTTDRQRMQQDVICQWGARQSIQLGSLLPLILCHELHILLCQNCCSVPVRLDPAVRPHQIIPHGIKIPSPVVMPPDLRPQAAASSCSLASGQSCTCCQVPASE